MIEEFTRWNIHQFFVAPGSRSTPVTAAIGRHPDAQAIVHYDERGTAFAALGFAKATGKPAVWVTTSGSAVANGLPALVEASADGIPLILLTADRPPELRQSGANQTINQSTIFGPYVKWHFDGPPPTPEIHPSFVLTTVDQAVHRATTGQGGAVHLNWMFREPLAPSQSDSPCETYLNNLDRWINSESCYTTYPKLMQDIDVDALSILTEGLRPEKLGIVVAGRLSNSEEGCAALQLAEKMGWPIFADVGSQIRLGPAHPCTNTWLLSEFFFHPFFSRFLSPVTSVIQVGRRCTSKNLLRWIAEADLNTYLVIDRYPDRIDPRHKVTHRIEDDIIGVCGALCSILGGHVPTSEHLTEQWKSINNGIQECLSRYWSRNTTLNEPLVARLISDHIREGQGLVIGNSMPVRDVDQYASYHGAQVRVSSSRGASGIDGTIATAAGFALGIDRNVTVLLGDLAFLHDLNSLGMLHHIPHNVTLVVINNDGGGIFSFLPIAKHIDVFEKYFGTPHGLTFRSAAELYGLTYYRPEDRAAFIQHYNEALDLKVSSIIEVPTHRVENVAIHRDIERELSHFAMSI